MLVVKIPIPLISVPSLIGQAIGNFLSSLSKKFLLPCSQIIFSASGSFLFCVDFKITIVYSLVFVIICLMYWSVIVMLDP